MLRQEPTLITFFLCNQSILPDVETQDDEEAGGLIFVHPNQRLSTVHTGGVCKSSNAGRCVGEVVLHVHAFIVAYSLDFATFQ